ncbi:UDP-glycosyltransferase 88A1 [Spatholobus suberectus]|nr:UDP-glycosyltransferase 88A1 [Spatholobus suberectus]
MVAKAFNFIARNASNVSTTLTQISKSATVKAFVIDLFCVSATEAASSTGIPVYYFFTSGAAVLALFSYLPKLHEQTIASFRDMVGVELRVPGNAPLKAVNVPEPVLDRTDPAYWDMLYFCTHLPNARRVIVNSFAELEPVAVNSVTEGACFPNPKHVAMDSKQCLSWLDKQPSRSVVYLCFGSRGSFSVSQLKEIANGLERSGHRFLWVVKRPTQEEGTKQEKDGFVSGEEVEKRVREVMESEEIRERSLKLKHLALAAVGEFGSSTTAVANLGQSWSGIGA